jgi:predicted alpha-1,2-mannosidase
MKISTIRRIGAFALTLAALSMPSAIGASPRPIDSVDPLVGTDGHGHTYPGATVPFGMVQLSPDTRNEGWDGTSGYHYDDTSIQGFSHTHLTGTGCGDLGDILVMPTVGDVRLDVGTPGNGYASRFSHAHEHASPGYYRVYLDTPRVTAELTATTRCGMHRYTFPESSQAHILVDLGHGIGNDNFDGAVNVENDTTISGFRKTHGWAYDRVVYFVMKFSKPFAGFRLAQDDTLFPDGTKTANGKHLKAVVDYHTTAGEPIVVKVGISGASLDGARKNLAAEIPGFDFDRVHRSAEAQWSNALGGVRIDAANPHVRRTFYTNLYQSFLAPTIYDDVDGSYMGMDHKVHPGGGFDTYTELSLWDVYRAECPLLTILQPSRTTGIVQSMLAEYRQNGLHMTPIWPLWGNETYCMIGYHAVPIIVDAYFKGLLGNDAEAAYQAIRDTAMRDREGLAEYRKLGYVPARAGGQATSKTIEYCVDDWCIARMAKALGHDDDARMFYQRAGNYVNLFDSRVGFERGRLADGQWRPHFNSHKWVGDEYTEADAWQYAFAAQHDVDGMIRLYGGDVGFTKKLDELFVEPSNFSPWIPDISGMIGQYSQGDEQSHHVAYLYDYAGQPWKTQMRVRQVMSTQYDDTPAGECGNIDCGQMSAWYVFSALGFYPVNPASGVYALGSPVVDKAVIHLDSKHYHGHTFTVIAKNNSKQNVYIQSATLNGKPLNRTWITQDEIAAGGTLSFVMGPTPKTTWGTSIAARPPSDMPAGYQYAALPTPSTAPVARVALTFPIRIACGSDTGVGDFVADPDVDTEDNNGSGNTIDTNVPDAAPAGVYQTERYGTDFTYSFKVPANAEYDLRLHFAEIFDSGAGERVEDVYVNGERRLSNFDVYAAAGGMNKAVVEDLKGVRPDANGKITIRIRAAHASPDQNAKISGIEILPLDRAASAP